MNVAVLTQVKSCRGRADAVLFSPHTIFVFGIKINKLASVALKQIDDQGYMIPYSADLDIAWFNPKTREIKFKEYDKIKSIPIYASISVKSSSETLFIIAANINPVVNRAYDDLVLFCDKDGKYYLNDNYPNYWNLEKTKQNADKRSEGWNKFINLLRKEGRIK